jgi:hypothetical protein
LMNRAVDGSAVGSPPALRSSSAVTSAPRFTSACVRWEPMNPAPPVTSVRTPRRCDRGNFDQSVSAWFAGMDSIFAGDDEDARCVRRRRRLNSRKDRKGAKNAKKKNREPHSYSYKATLQIGYPRVFFLCVLCVLCSFALSARKRTHATSEPSEYPFDFAQGRLSGTGVESNRSF